MPERGLTSGAVLGRAFSSGAGVSYCRQEDRQTRAHRWHWRPRRRWRPRRHRRSRRSRRRNRTGGLVGTGVRSAQVAPPSRAARFRARRSRDGRLYRRRRRSGGGRRSRPRRRTQTGGKSGAGAALSGQCTGGRIGTGGTSASGGAGGFSGTGGAPARCAGHCRSHLSGQPVLRHAPVGDCGKSPTRREPALQPGLFHVRHLPASVRMRRQDLRQRLRAPGCRSFHGLAGRVPACPADISQIGTWPCTEGLTCEYGTDPRPNCRPSATCTNGIWTVLQAKCTQLPP